MYRSTKIMHLIGGNNYKLNLNVSDPLSFEKEIKVII